MQHRSILQQVWRSLLAGTFALVIGHPALAGQDTTGPEVTIKRRPAANSAGWNNTPVTVSFTCTDPSGVASCPGPVVVTAEGASIPVSRTATDSLGNETPISVTLAIDRTPPAVTLDEPSDSVTTSATSLAVGAAVSDALSGGVQASCNGESATVDAGEVECTASLRPGINGFVISAVDQAGNAASHGLTITRTGATTSIMIAPSQKTLLVGRETTLALSDEFGVPVVATSWTSADPSVATVTVEDMAVVTGVAGGTTTITAEWSTLSATATVSIVSGVVLPSGLVALPPGTVEWQVSNASPFVAAAAIDSGRFSYLLSDYAAGAVRAIAYNGQEAARYAMPDSWELRMAHARGGFLIRTTGGIARHAPPFGERPWSHTFASGEDAAYILQDSQGMVYLVYYGGFVEVLDGETGVRLKREDLPMGRSVTLHFDCLDWDQESEWVEMGVPAIDGADRLRLPLFITNSVFDSLPCNVGTLVSYDRTAKLLTLTSTDASYTTLASIPLSSIPQPSPWTVATDNDGSVMVGAVMDSGSGELGAYVTDSGVSMHSSPLPVSREGVVVGDGNVAYASAGSALIAFDTTTGATVWNSGIDARPLAPIAGGGVAAADNTTAEMLHFDAAGVSTVAGPPTAAKMLGLGGSWIGEAWDPVNEVTSVQSSVGAGVMSNFSFVGTASYYEAGGNSQKSGGPKRSCTNAPYIPRFLSLAPGNLYTYRFFSTTFKPAEREAIVEAFEAWSQVNTTLMTTFSQATGSTEDIRIFKAPLADKVGGGMAEGTITAGMISGGDMYVTSKTNYVWKPQGFLKVALHEIGHFLGLDDIEDANIRKGGSVMNKLGVPPGNPILPAQTADDPIGNIPLWPTYCDVEQARLAPSRPWP